MDEKKENPRAEEPRGEDNNTQTNDNTKRHFIVETNPWPEHVKGCELLTSLSDTFKRHVVIKPEEADTLALFVLFTHAHDAARFSPILAVTARWVKILMQLHDGSI